MELKDYLHYYLGCQMIYSSHHQPQNEPYILTFENIREAVEFDDRPLLRRLEDMTEEEKREHHSLMFEGTDGVHQVVVMMETPDSFHYLLRQHFDLFGLIDAGLAIDAKNIER